MVPRSIAMSATAATPLTRNARADRIFANANAIADAICDANWFAMIGSPQLAKARRAFDAGLADFNQLHNSLNGGSAEDGGIDEVPPPGPLLDPLLDPEPLLAP